MKKWIAVYSSSSEELNKSFYKLARDMGSEIANKGFNLVYGGGNIGMMAIVAHSVKNHGGDVIGVIPDYINDHVPKFENCDDLIITKSMKSRKAKIEEIADAFIALPGGFGTLEEILEIITLKQLHYHNKAIVFVNYNGFFNSLFDLFNQLFNLKFASTSYRKLFYISNSVHDAVDYINNYKPIEHKIKWE